MTDKILNPEEKMKEIKDRQDPHQAIIAKPPICPFMSSPEREVSCTPRCKLYRSNRANYECYFMEMQSISWNTRRQGGQAPQPGYQPPPQY